MDLFFVLSGFLITGILLDAKGMHHYFRNFYARRTLRIFPLNYAFLAVTLIILPHLLPWSLWHPYDDSKLMRFAVFAYLGNFVVAWFGVTNPVDVTWSLAIEEQFYLIWPALILILRPQQVKILCGVLIGVSIFSRCIMVLAGRGHDIPFIITPCRMDGLAMGAFMAVIAPSMADYTVWPDGLLG